MKLLTSEWLKTKHTLIRWVIFLFPMFVSACIITYCMYRKDISADIVYELFFTVWSTMIFPIAVSIFTGFYSYEEEMAGNFNRFLCCCLSRQKLYLSKFAMSAISLTVCTFLTTLMVSIGLDIVLPQNIDIHLFTAAALLSLLSALPILAIHTWISFAFGMGASVGVGIFGLLAATLMGTTNLGNQLWHVTPWTYPVKMSVFPLAYSFTESNLKMTVQASFILCIALSIVLGILFLLLGILWFHKWEGRKNE